MYNVVVCLQMAETYTDKLNTWLTFVSISKMKSFVELIPASSVRAGTQTLLAVRHCYTMYIDLHVAAFPDRFEGSHSHISAWERG